MKAINSKRVGKYLLYALGEIILVVAGILIALNINNANEQKKNTEKFKAILHTVTSDLKSDTLLVADVLKNFNSRKRVLDPILKGKFTDKQFETCLMCGPYITNFYPINFNDKGYLQLKNFYDNTEGVDSLSIKIVQFYNKYTATISELEEEVKTTTIETVKHWRDNYPWFANMRNNIRDKRYAEYLKSEDYRNRVAFFNIMATNFTFYLQYYKRDATEILRDIEAFENQN